MFPFVENTSTMKLAVVMKLGDPMRGNRTRYCLSSVKTALSLPCFNRSKTAAQGGRANTLGAPARAESVSRMTACLPSKVRQAVRERSNTDGSGSDGNGFEVSFPVVGSNNMNCSPVASGDS